ncbi:phosphotransferase family protein [Desulfobaculum sp. SPO524]|uniref:phosphotransferase family protein n=1 Tax=Desulfobaculum sp. SPO524 TaxID=3378071 RepID=UPI0038532891
MIELTLEAVERYLRDTFGSGVKLTGVGEIGSLDEQGMKDFGYGKPLLVSWEENGETRQAVLSMMRGDRYGHQGYWDRARVLLFQHAAGPKMERHVRPLGLGYVDTSGHMVPVTDPQEFFIINEKIQGRDYFLDLYRIREGDFRPQDEHLAREFALWLARIHSRKNDDPDLYIRRIRNLVGDCECIFGIADGYPHPYSEFPPERFVALEKRLIDWRWKLRGYTDRLAEVHGDFHPWNVLVQDGEPPSFGVLDRSRGEWGDPADDVATMTLNYLLFGLYDTPRLSGAFEKLYRTLWDTYLEETGDRQMLEVIAPFYVFRALVVASPEWYPDHPIAVRRGLFRLIENVLEDDTFDWRNINKYME